MVNLKYKRLDDVRYSLAAVDNRGQTSATWCALLCTHNVTCVAFHMAWVTSTEGQCELLQDASLKCTTPNTGYSLFYGSMTSVCPVSSAWATWYLDSASNTCYYFSPPSFLATIGQSYASCSLTNFPECDGVKVADIQTAAEQTFITNTHRNDVPSNKQCGNYWLNGQRISATQFQWSTGETVVFDMWAALQPSTTDMSQAYMNAVAYLGQPWQWYDRFGTEVTCAICEV